MGIWKHSTALKRSTAAVSLVCVGALVLAACSSTSSSSSAAASSSGSSSSASSSSAASSAAPTKSPVTVALIDPLTGPFGFFGQYVKNSLQLEVNLLNQHGGLLGHKVVLQAYDDKLDPQTTVQVATQVADNPNVDLVVGPDITSFFDAAKGIMAKANKLECEVAIDSDTGLQGQPYAFNMNPDNQVVVETLLSYLKNHTSVRSVGMVYEQDATGEQTNSDFQALAPKYGIKYLGVQYTSANESNYVPQIQKLMSAGAIYFSNLTPNNVETATSAQQAGYKGILINGTGAQAYFYPQGAGPAASGTVFVSGPLFLPGMTTAPQSQWPSGYRTFYNQTIAAGGKIAKGTKPGLEELEGTSEAAPCIQFWAAAAAKAGTLNGPAVAKAWASLNVPPSQNALGMQATFSNGQLFTSPNQLYVYRWNYANGRWSLQVLAKPSA